MIRYLKGAEIDTDKWDACLHRDGCGVIYGCSWYLDSLGVDWDALVYGDYETVMPLVYKRKYGLSYIYRPAGVQQLGLFGRDADSPQMLYLFLSSIPKHFQLVDLFTNAHNALGDLPAKWRKTGQRNFILRMDASYSDIYGRFSKGIKWNIKKAAAFKHKIFEHDPPEVLIRMFQKHQGKKYAVGDAQCQLMRQLMYSLLHKKRGVLWSIHDERNSPLAAAFFAEFDGRVVLLFLASDEYAQNTHATSHLINEYLIYRSGNIRLFDFEGGNSEGMRRYYSGFGAEESVYYHLRRNTLPWPIRLLKR